MTTQVLIALNGPYEGRIAAALDPLATVTVARRCADLGEALAAAHAGIGDAVLLDHQPRLTRDVVADFAAAGLSVVGVADTDERMGTLRGIGVPRVVSPDEDNGILVTALAEALDGAIRAIPPVSPPGFAAFAPHPSADGARSHAGAPMPRTRGALVAVWGPTGAPGRTTLAVTLAHEAARDRSVLLVDADTYGGAVAQALGVLDEAPGLAALARACLAGGIDDAAFERHAALVAPRLRLLTGITRADRWPELSASALDQVWDKARDNANLTVVDCGFGLERDEALQYDTRAPQRNAATLSALAAADLVVVVGSAEPLGMQRLIHGLGQLDEVVPVSTTARMVVVNRVRSSVAGIRPREAIADALKRYCGVESTWTVPWDPKGCDAAALAGKALGEAAPRSPSRRAIAGIAREVLVAVRVPAA